MSTLRQALETIAQQLLIDCTYSSRGHFSDCQRWQRWNTWLGAPLVLSSATLALGAALIAIFGDNKALTAILALLSAAITAIHGFFRPDEQADQHGLKAARYNSLGKAVRFFHQIELASDTPEQDLVERLHSLQERYDALTETPPRTISPGAYATARRGIAAGEASYQQDPLWPEVTK